MATIPAHLFVPFGGYASAPEKKKIKYELRVGASPGRSFPMGRWREGILFFLFGVWSGAPGPEPKISFGSITLSLDSREKRYSVWGNTIGEDCNTYYGNYSLDVNNNQNEVEVALARFAKDDHLGCLRIKFPGEMLLKLWKKERRGEYGAHMMYVG